MRILQKIARLPVIAILFAVCLFFVLYLFPHFDVKSISYKLEILDIRSSYSFADVSDLFKALGADGIKLYKEILIVDTFYPMVYTSLFILCMVYLGSAEKLFVATKWLNVNNPQ